MQKYGLILSLVVLVLASAACQPATQPEVVETDTTEADIAALRNIVARYDAFVNSSDVDGIVGLYTADARSMPPDAAPAVGSDEIRAQAEAPEEEGSATELTSTVEDARVAADLGVLRIQWTATSTPEGEEPTTEQGKWILICERQADGSWKITDEMWTTYEP